LASPEKVIHQFQTIPPRSTESDFHGPYNKLLNTLFPPDTDFTVMSQYLQPAFNTWADYTVSFEVFLENKPVLILQLKKPADLAWISSRKQLMRILECELADIVHECLIPTLHAVSAMGTRLCFYHVGTAAIPKEIIPHNIPRHPVFSVDTAVGL
ncbi:hypothetical protein BS47DRAFT_1453681, partial [Hydnum rufescens UP504]